MPVVISIFGAAGTDANWPSEPTRANNYKINNAPTNDGYTPNPLSPLLGRVIRSITLWSIYADPLFYEYRRRAGVYPGNFPPSGYSAQTSRIYAYDLNRIRDILQTNPPALGTPGYVDITGTQTRAYWQASNGAYYWFAQCYGYTAGFAGASAGSYVTAANVNSIIDKITGAAAVCVCNCNYCTCNCNYCACNCNYACTCNCNYSDERLKQEIQYC